MWVLLMLPRFGGARSAQSITASGHTRRINRTRPMLQQRQKG